MKFLQTDGKMYVWIDGPTERGMYEGQQVIRNVHLNFQIRWARNMPTQKIKPYNKMQHRAIQKVDVLIKLYKNTVETFCNKCTRYKNTEMVQRSKIKAI